MADLQSGQTFINVLPSMTGYFKKVRAEVQNNKIEQNIGVKVDQRRLDQAKRALEATVKAEETARRKAADAAGAQVVAEAKLQALRDKGVTDVGRLSAAEQTLEKAKRNSIAASQALSDAEGKRKVADRRVQRVEATFDSSKAETQSDSFLQRLAAKAESSGQGIGSRLVAGIGKTAKAGALAVGGTIAGVLGVAAKKGIDRMLAIDDAKGKLLGLGNTAADVEAIMANASASVKGTAFGLGEAAGLAGTLVASGIRPGEALERQLKLVADAATVSGSDLGEMGQIWGKVAAKGKLDGEVMAQMLERQIPIFDILGRKYGKSAEEIQKMVSEGKVSFADFADAMQAKVGGAALASGATVRGAAKNMGAALGRLGEAGLAPFFGQATTVFGGVTGLIDKMTARVKVWSEQVGNGLEFVKGILVEGDFKGEFAKALNIDEDAPIVDKLFRIRERVQQAFEAIKLLFTGDFTESFRKAFNVEEDAPIVEKILGIRETLQGWGEQIGRIFGTVKDTLVQLAPPVGQIIASLGQASASIGISVWSVFLDVLEALLPVIKDVLVPAVEKLADLMAANPGVVTAVVGAYTAYRTAIYATAGALKAKAMWTKLTTKTVKDSTKATVLDTARTKVWNAVKTASKAAAEKAAKGVKALNTAIKANPIMAIVSAITVLVGALVWFFTQTETGKRIWETVWSGIQTALSAAWGFIQPIFEAIGAIFTWLYENIVQPIFTALKIALAVVITAFLLWWQWVSFVIGMIGQVLTSLWTTVAQPIWELMKTALRALGDFFAWVWSSLIKPAWDGLAAGIKWAWENVIRPAWDALKTALQAVGAFFGWVWNSLIKPAWDGLGAGISWVWQNVIRPAWDGLRAALQALGDFFRWIWENAIKPAWDALGTGINWVWENVIRKAWDAMTGALGKVRDFFGEVVRGIQDKWDSLRAILAKPINFLINTVWNGGILKAWNKAADLLGLDQAQPLDGIPEHATGGAIRGPGSGTSDDVLMWGSNGEHMLTTKEVQRVGGHNAVYALRDMIMRGVPFTWDGGQIIRELGRDNVNAYGAKVAQKGLGNVNPQGMFDWLLPKYKDGGEIRPAWESQLENGHRAAKMRNGNPYTWGFEDCSGYMSAIADAIIHGGDGKWSWATGSFPGGQPWVPGLGEGFSVGVWDDPGGPGGGHTAGTLTGVGPYSTTNVESGGAHNYVAYGGPAVGADAPIFAGKSPGLFHLAIGADGAFESAGGPSPEQKKSWLQQKISGVFDFFLNPVKGMFAGAIGTPPPAWRGVPPAFLDKGRDMTSKFLSDKVENLGSLLGSVWNKAKSGFGLFRDQGGWIPNGLSIVRNETGKPEAVLNWEQIMALRDLFETGDYTSALSRVGIEEDHPYVDAVLGLRDLIVNGDYTPAVRRQFGIEEDHPVVGAVLGARDGILAARANLDAAGTYASEIDWGGVGAQIGTSLLAEWGNDLLGMAGLSNRFEGVKLVDDTGRRRSDETALRNEASFNDTPAAEPSVEPQAVPVPVEAQPESVVDAVKRAFSQYGWESGEQWAATDWIVQKESGWNPLARNPQSGAFSLFQFLGSTKDQYLPDESTDPYTQGVAGAKYIRDRYGDPIRAKSFWERNGYYDQGGIATGKGYLLKDVIHPERVLSPRQTAAFEQLVPMLDRMQQSTTAPADAMPASALSSLEYAPVGVGGDTFNVYGETSRRTMNEVGIFSNQRTRSRRYDGGQR
ncbi:tape measure protein [Rhodococcus hoagii]|nr:tape measure protein [Prescottella equi]